MADDKKLVLSQSSEDVVNILDKALLNDQLGQNLKIDSDGKLDLKQEITTAKSLSVADEAERLALGTINNLYIVRQLDDNEHDYYLNAGLDASDNANWNVMTRDKEYTGDDIVYTDVASGVRYVIHIKNGEPYGLAVPDGMGTLNSEPMPLVVNADNMYIKDESLSNKYYLHADNGIFSIKDENDIKYDSMWWGSGHIGTEGIFHNGTDSGGTDHTIGMYTNDGQGNYASGLVTSDSALAIGLNNGADRPFYATKDKVITTSIEPIATSDEIGSLSKPFQHANIKGLTLRDTIDNDPLGIAFKAGKLNKVDGSTYSEIGGLELFVEDVPNKTLEPKDNSLTKIGSLTKPLDAVRTEKTDFTYSESVKARIDANSSSVDFDVFENMYFKRNGSSTCMSIDPSETGVKFNESPILVDESTGTAYVLAFKDGVLCKRVGSSYVPIGSSSDLYDFEGEKIGNWANAGTATSDDSTPNYTVSNGWNIGTIIDTTGDNAIWSSYGSKVVLSANSSYYYRNTSTSYNKTYYRQDSAGTITNNEKDISTWNQCGIMGGNGGNAATGNYTAKLKIRDNNDGSYVYIVMQCWAGDTVVRYKTKRVTS